MLATAEIGSTIDKDAYEARVPDLRVDLLNAQFDLQHADFAALIIIDGDDRWGCEELIDRIHEWMDARHIDTHVFEDPTEAERRHPRFWRYWRALPPKGRTGLFLGAYPLMTVRGLLFDGQKRAVFDRRVVHDRLFEKLLADDGTLILKFYLHLPKREMERRLKKARKHPERYRYIQERDYEVVSHYDRAMPVIEDYLARTSAPHAPWTIVESTDERYRDLTVMRTIRDAIVARLADGGAPGDPPVRVGASPDALGAVDLDARAGNDYDDRLEGLQSKLNRRSRDERDAGLSTVLCFEGWDAAGKGGTIRRITSALDARNYTVVSIAAPDAHEKRFHYLWRFWTRIPEPGRFAIFDRSWYGRVLVERVERFATEAQWGRAYAEIRDFEEQLAEHGLIVLKFWLHIDPDEQQRRFEARARTPYKKYKLTDEDERNRARWPDYADAVNDMVARTSTPGAPWHIVAANDKKHARLTVLETVNRALKARL